MPQPQQSQSGSASQSARTLGNSTTIAALATLSTAVVAAVFPGEVTALVLGPLAAAVGMVALMKRIGNKRLALNALILGLISTGGGILFLHLDAQREASRQSAKAPHKIEYRVRTNVPANINYRAAGESASEAVTANIAADSIGDNATVGCELLINGESVSSDTATGTGATALWRAKAFP